MLTIDELNEWQSLIRKYELACVFTLDENKRLQQLNDKVELSKGHTCFSIDYE